MRAILYDASIVALLCLTKLSESFGSGTVSGLERVDVLLSDFLNIRKQLGDLSYEVSISMPGF